MRTDIKTHIERTLKKAGYNPITYAKEVARYLNIPADKLHTTPSPEILQKLQQLHNVLVKEDMPIEYLLGYAQFYGLKFMVKPPVYIPNPFTERLVEKVLHFLKTQVRPNTPLTIIDIGTGTGALIISIAKNTPSTYAGVELLATEKHHKAFQIAALNLRLHGLQKKIKLIRANVAFVKGAPIIPLYEHVIIVTNKPYLPNSAYQSLPRSVKYQSPTALLKNPSFERLLKKYINFLIHRGHTVDLFMETLRTHSPLSAKIVHYTYKA